MFEKICYTLITISTVVAVYGGVTNNFNLLTDVGVFAMVLAAAVVIKFIWFD